jgi:hypothetical protein
MIADADEVEAETVDLPHSVFELARRTRRERGDPEPVRRSCDVVMVGRELASLAWR